MTFHWTSTREAERLTREAASLTGPLPPLTPPAHLVERTTAMAIDLLHQAPATAPRPRWRLPVLVGALASVLIGFLVSRPAPLAPPLRVVTADAPLTAPAPSPRTLQESERAVDARLLALRARAAQLEHQLTLEQLPDVDRSIAALQAHYQQLVTDLLEQDGRPAARGRRI